MESTQASLGTSFGSGGLAAARTPHLRLRNLIDFREHQGGFVLERDFHRFEVVLGIFSGTKLETQVAQIIVERVAALEQLIELRAVWSEGGCIRLNIENEESGGESQRETRAENGPIRGGDEKGCYRCANGQDQSSVSRAAWARARSSSSLEIGAP